MNTGNPMFIISHFDLVGLHSETKPSNVKDGSTFFEVDTSTLFIFYKGTWYEQGLDNSDSQSDDNVEESEEE